MRTVRLLAFLCCALLVLTWGTKKVFDLNAAPPGEPQGRDLALVEYAFPFPFVRPHTSGHNNVIAVSPDGKLLATGAEATLVVWDVKSRKQISRMQLPARQLNIHVAFSADSATLISNGQYDDMVRFWDVKTGKQVRERAHGGSMVTGREYHSPFMAFAPGAAQMAVREHGKNIRLIDTATGKTTAELADTAASSWANAAFSADGSLLAACFEWEEPQVKLWDPQTGKLVRTIGEPRQTVRRGYGYVTFSPDGKYLAATHRSADVNYLDVWGVEDGKRYCRFRASHTNGAVYFDAAAFSNDSRLLAAATADGRFQLFDLQADKQLTEFKLPEGEACYNLLSTKDGGLVILAGTRDTTGKTSIYLAQFPKLPEAKRFNALDAAEQDDLWAGLGGENEFRRLHARKMFLADAEQAARFASQKVKPAPAQSRKHIDDWIKRLDDDDPNLRDRATAELQRVAFVFEPLLTEAAKTAAVGEVRNRLSFVTREMKKADLPSSLKSDLAGIALLRQLDVPAARKVLEELAAGADGARVTHEAADALTSWGR